MKEKEPQCLAKEEALLMNKLLSNPVTASPFEDFDGVHYLGYRPTDSRDEMRMKLLTPGL